MRSIQRLRTPVQKPASAVRDAIMGAALRCFAEEGIEEATMRSITAAAGTSLGTVNYYFGSKLALEYEVFDAVVRRASEQRFAEYDNLEKSLNGGPVPVELIVRALLRPYVEGDEDWRRVLIRIVQLHRFAPTALTRELMYKYFDKLAVRTIDMLRRTLPNVSRSDVSWRYHLALGAIQSVLRDCEKDNRLKRISRGSADASNRSQLVEQTVAFVVAGLMQESRAGSSAASGSLREVL